MLSQWSALFLVHFLPTILVFILSSPKQETVCDSGPFVLSSIFLGRAAAMWRFPADSLHSSWKGLSTTPPLTFSRPVTSSAAKDLP